MKKKELLIIIPIIATVAIAFILMLMSGKNAMRTQEQAENYTLPDEWEERPSWITDNDESYLAEVYGKATDKTNVARMTSKILKSRYGIENVETDTNYLVQENTPFDGYTSLGLTSKIDGKTVNVQVAVGDDCVYTFADDYEDAKNLLALAKETQEYSNNIPATRMLFEEDISSVGFEFTGTPYGLYNIEPMGNNYFGYTEGHAKSMNGEYAENVLYHITIDISKLEAIKYDEDYYEDEISDMYYDVKQHFPCKKLLVTFIDNNSSKDFELNTEDESFSARILEMLGQFEKER